MLFWGDFRISRTTKIPFLHYYQKVSFWGIQDFQLTVHKENVIMGRFGLHIFNHENYEGENYGTYSKICRFGGINSDFNS